MSQTTDDQVESLRKLLCVLRHAAEFGTDAYLPCMLYLGRNPWSKSAHNASLEIEAEWYDLDDKLRQAKHELVATGFAVPKHWLAAGCPELKISDGMKHPVVDDPQKCEMEIEVAPADPRLAVAIREIEDEIAAYQYGSCTSTTLERSGPADGPHPPDGFSWDGTNHGRLPPIPWRLVNFLWHARDRTAEFDELADPVWRDHNQLVLKDAVGSARSKANQFFRRHGIPLRITTKNQHAQLAEENNSETS